MRRQPRWSEQQRRPPRVAEQHHRRDDTGEQLDQPARDEVHGNEERRPAHPEVEVARERKVGRESRVLQVAHPRRRDAGIGEVVVQHRCGAVAEVGAQAPSESESAPEARRRRLRKSLAAQSAIHRLRPRRPGGRPPAPARKAAHPRSNSTVHQATVSGPSARGRARKNFHSCRLVSLFTACSLAACVRLGRSAPKAACVREGADASRAARSANACVSRTLARVPEGEPVAARDPRP